MRIFHLPEDKEQVIQEFKRILSTVENDGTVEVSFHGMWWEMSFAPKDSNE